MAIAVTQGEINGRNAWKSARMHGVPEGSRHNGPIFPTTRACVLACARVSAHQDAAMAVEFISAAHVRAITARLAAARQRAVDRCGVPPAMPAAGYWQTLFEANAAEVLAEMPSVRLTPGHAVRYRFFGQRSGDLLVRPFVARASTDVETIRQLIEWHPAPDSVAISEARRPTQDVDLLYRHWTYEPTAVGVFEYWLAMQEIWASQRWAHSHVIASATELSEITASPG